MNHGMCAIHRQEFSLETLSFPPCCYALRRIIRNLKNFSFGLIRIKQFAADFNSDFTVGTWVWSSLRKHLLLSELKDVRVLAPVVSSEKCYLIWSKIIPIWYIKKGTRYSCLTTNGGWCSNILGSKRLAQLSNVAQRPIVQLSNMIRTKKENINELCIFNLILGATKEAQTGRW